MKKYILITLMLFTAYNVFCCDMAAVISTHSSGDFYSDYYPSQMNLHYTVQLNKELNACPHPQGRGLMFYNDNETGGIWSFRPNSFHLLLC